jgi:hypothetical protein
MRQLKSTVKDYMNNFSSYLFSLCLLIIAPASTSALAESSDKLSVKDRRKARTAKIFKSNFGIKRRYTAKEKIRIDLKRQDGFTGKVEAISEVQKVKSKVRALDRTNRTQGLIRKKEKDMRNLAHFKRRKSEKKRRRALRRIRRAQNNAAANSSDGALPADGPGGAD